jgi:hypothetical protein
MLDKYTTIKQRGIKLAFEKILELLKDGKWHETNQVIKAINIPVNQVNEILQFYEKFNFIRFNRFKTKIAIDQKLKKIL